MKITVIMLALFVALACYQSVPAQDAETIQLPMPQMDGGKPLMQALKARQSIRNFTEKSLPMQVLSDLLWAADGINRPESGKRTAPTAVNWQEIDIYVAMASGLYLYDAKTHALKCIVKNDVRAMTGRQHFVEKAPLNLIYVADWAKINSTSDDEKKFYSATDTGFISQNVYLFCASEGLATVVRGMIDREALSKVMKLRPEQKIQLAQTVGYPAK